jgi:hypothetical protein
MSPAKARVELKLTSESGRVKAGTLQAHPPLATSARSVTAKWGGGPTTIEGRIPSQIDVTQCGAQREAEGWRMARHGSCRARFYEGASALAGLPFDSQRMQNQAVALRELRTLGNDLVGVKHRGVLGCAPSRVIENTVAEFARGIGVGPFRFKDGIEVIHD